MSISTVIVTQHSYNYLRMTHYVNVDHLYATIEHTSSVRYSEWPLIIEPNIACQVLSYI